jgi:hypothetical protein
MRFLAAARDSDACPATYWTCISEFFLRKLKRSMHGSDHLTLSSARGTFMHGCKPISPPPSVMVSWYAQGRLLFLNKLLDYFSTTTTTLQLTNFCPSQSCQQSVASVPNKTLASILIQPNMSVGGGSTGIAPFIPNSCWTWSLVISFTLQSVYSQGRNPRNPLTGCSVGPRACLEAVHKT